MHVWHSQETQSPPQLSEYWLCAYYLKKYVRRRFDIALKKFVRWHGSKKMYPLHCTNSDEVYLGSLGIHI